MTGHVALLWLAHHHMTQDQIRQAMVALVHQVQHLRMHRTNLWLTHIRGWQGDGVPRVLVLTVKLGRGVLAAHWG
jgi:hypothetical protein